MSNQKYLGLIPILVGILLLSSGAGKVVDTESFRKLIEDYGLSYFSIFAPMIVIIEITLGLMLLLSVNIKKAALIAFLMLVIFTIAFGYGYLFKGIEDCGCFGKIKVLKMPPLVTFLRNILLLVLTFWVWKKYPVQQATVVKWKLYSIFILIAFSSYVSGLTYQSDIKNIYQHNPYLNSPVKNTLLSNYVKTSPDSTYIVYVFTFGCTHCWDGFENAKFYKESGMVNSVIGLGNGTKEQHDFVLNYLHPTFPVTVVQIDTLLNMVTEFPTAYYIKNDSVKFVMEKDIFSPYSFDVLMKARQ